MQFHRLHAAEKLVLAIGADSSTGNQTSLSIHLSVQCSPSFTRLLFQYNMAAYSPYCETVDVAKLLGERKLVLLVDLDATVIVSNITREPQPSPTEDDVGSFTMNARIGKKYCTTRIRPGAREFLAEMTEFFECYVATHGKKHYAENIVRLLDPEDKIFKNRIYSYEFFQTYQTKIEIMDAMFRGQPNPPVAIIDDRADVWRGIDHLFKVTPYHGPQQHDEEEGYLNSVAQVLKKVHQMFFAQMTASDDLFLIPRLDQSCKTSGVIA